MTPSKKQIGGWATNFGLLAVVVAGVYGVIAFIDYRVDQRLGDDANLRRVAAMVRPSCVFDQNGSILYDSGAMNIIESVELSKEPTQEGKQATRFPRTIVVRPNRLLKEAPLLTAIDPFFLEVHSERGKKYDWVYTIQYTGGPNKTRHSNRHQPPCRRSFLVVSPFTSRLDARSRW